ncbi:conserved unknown protein [Ectocarpus siliculosus]|uniref:Uncharacterized protein n=1 Tax=Ectocarpus siliculosus TaxID=2880 RepID=D7FRY0_ECTSI|nr:conserved unknown protein [Ectocarpus siliculosus]|eukprot:CBJ30921.1 conserved unknown protein [Ectocarpus siliculosus]
MRSWAGRHCEWRDADGGEEEAKQLCLDRKSCDSVTSVLRTASCDHCGAKGWDIVGDVDSSYTLSVGRVQPVVAAAAAAASDGMALSTVFEQAAAGVGVGGGVAAVAQMCIVRDGEAARMGGCEEQTRLTLQFASEHDMAAMGAPGVRLITAASDGNKKGVKKWLDQGVDVDSRDWDNLTPLIAASSQGHLDVVKILLQRGAGVNSKDKDNITALMEASIMDHRDVVKHLLKEGAEVDAKTTTGVTALWLAAGEGRKEVAASLIAKDSDVNNRRTDGITAVMAAAVGGHKDVVKMLVDAGAGVSDRDQDGLTALMNAAEIGAGEIVTYLLNKGADPNVMSETGFTSLILAAAGGHLEVVKTLVEKGAEINAEHPEGVNALMYGAAGAHLGVVQYLLDPAKGMTGAEVNQLHVHGGSALMEASTSGNVSVINLLLKKGADVSVTDKDGVTTLMSAASHGHAQACKVLLDAGAPLDTKASSGGTALMFAAAAGYTDVVALLLERGAHVNDTVQVSRGLPLQYHANANHVQDVMRALVEGGADVRAVDDQGLSALLNAVKGNFGDAASYLVEKGADANDVYVDEGGDRHSLLMDAIIVENVPFAELLVKHGADVNVTDEQGVTTLIQAAHRGMLVICELVVEKGVAVAAKSDDGITALIAAASEGHAGIVELLLGKAKADPDAKDKDGTTALMAASVRGHKDVVDALLRHGANVDQQNLDGHTALMFAYNGRNQVAALLSRYLEYVGGKEDDGNAKIIQDSLQVHTNIIAALQAADADPGLLDTNGNSAQDFDSQHPTGQETEGGASGAGRLEPPRARPAVPPTGDRDEL